MPATEGARSPLRVAAAALPACLGELSHPPAALWCLGDVDLLRRAPERIVAIVGTREASEYGVSTAARLAAAAAAGGLAVVSGLARGVDAAAHRGALEAGGATIAVLGTGVDVPYPAGHRSLHEAIAGQGLVISEAEPGSSAKPGCFPRRNRLIAALARVTVVVEAGFRSGAMNTASHALDLGRTVAGVPGRIDDHRAAGVNLLIRDGAHVIASVEDLLNLFGLSTGMGPRGSADANEGCPWTEGEGGPDELVGRALRRLLESRPHTLEDAAFSLGVPIRQVATALSRLELAGLIVRRGAVFAARS